MGWLGILVLGVAVGLAGGWLHPLRRPGTTRRRLAIGVAAGVAGAAFGLMAGNVTGLFHDGELLEWPVCTAFALIAVAVTVGLFSRR